MIKKHLSIRDIATRANVSTATVSNVLNGTGRVSESTRRRVEHVIKENNFVPSVSARNLRNKKSHLIAVVVPILSKKGSLRDNTFYWHLVKGVEEGARRQQFDVLLMGIDKDETFSFVSERHLDGLIVVGAFEHSPIVRQLSSINVPCVFIDSYLSDVDAYCVNLDDYQGGYIGAFHLVGLGHRNIMLVTGELEHGGVNFHRWRGYCKALEHGGITYRPEFVVEEPVSLHGGRMAVHHILGRLNEVTAVFALSDVVAAGIIRGLHEMRISVPHDISVIGFDDIDYADYMIPALTTVKQDISKKGIEAVRLLLSKIEGSECDSRNVILSPDIKVRESTARPRTTTN